MPTHIRLTNASNTELVLSTSVSPDLDHDRYTILETSLPSLGESTEILRFNRDEGITNGKTWVFTTSFVLDGTTVLLEQRLTGTLITSDLEQSMRIGDLVVGWTDEVGAIHATFSGWSGAAYEILMDRTSGGLGFGDIDYTCTVTEPADITYEHRTPVMPQIKTVVYLMLENRSLDNVLGWLYDADKKPNVIYPHDSVPQYYDGIPADAFNDSGSERYVPREGTSTFPQPFRVPRFDPYEPMAHVKYQLYANGDGELPLSEPRHDPNKADDYLWDHKPTMTGFAWDYHASYDDPHEVMGAYSDGDLPVLSGLAKEYAVSDRWFASVPTQTDPNRAFSVCGTSLGAEKNSDIDENTFAEASTIFNALGANGKTWGLYYQTEFPLGTGEPITSWEPFTSYYFSQLNNAPNGSVKKFDEFCREADAGQLPNFCFLEPSWGVGLGAQSGEGFFGIQGNDYHPPTWVGPAEDDLNKLYETLISSPQWDEMLFIVSFDEHGGTYDHVKPPTALAPDTNVGPSGFRFDRLGVRVPTILVSPFIDEGTVFRAPTGSTYDFDHTSFIATMLKWAGVKPTSAGLGERVGVAATFDDVLSRTRRADTPRFEVPAFYAAQGGGTGHPNLGADHDGGLADSLDFKAVRHASEACDSAEEFGDRLLELGGQPAASTDG